MNVGSGVGVDVLCKRDAPSGPGEAMGDGADSDAATGAGGMEVGGASGSNLWQATRVSRRRVPPAIRTPSRRLAFNVAIPFAAVPWARPQGTPHSNESPV